MTLLPRQYSQLCRNTRTGQLYYCRSAWNSWGRWVAMTLIIIFFFFVFFCFSCITARRRRKLGQKPMYGTGWAGRLPGTNAGTNYNPNYNQQQSAPPPAYNQTSGSGTNPGHFGGQRNDVEMQAPQNTYQGGDNVYAPPSGPPPSKYH